MWIEVLVDAIVGTLADRGAQRGLSRLGRRRQAVSLAVLIVLGLALAGLGAWLVARGEPLWAAALMWAIAALMLVPAGLMIRRMAKGKQGPKAGKAA